MSIPDVSLDRVLGRTREVEGCLEWAGYAVNGKFPQIRVDYVLYPVRRLVWQLTRGPVLNPEFWIGCKDGCSALCVNPDHLVGRLRSKALKNAKRDSGMKMKIAQGKRKKSKITMKFVKEIRASNESNQVLADQFGIDPGYVSKIRHFKVWNEYVTPFTGLGAR